MILDNAETRYSVVNAGLSYTAAVAHKALAIKPYFGKYCYLAAGLAVFYGGFQPPMYRLDLYNHYQKEERLTYSADTDATIFSIFNGRYGGKGITFAPLALMNDGLIDICFNKEEMRSADFR